MEMNKRFIRQVRDEYVPKERTKFDDLKELDNKVKLPAYISAYTIGIIGALVMGVGMCLAMKILGAAVLSATTMTVLGVIIGLVGIALCVANYFIYKAILNARKKKYGDQIVSLSNELLNQES